MTEITEPILLDKTGWELNERLLEIRNAITSKGGTSGKVYGFHINPSESDPEDAITYLGNAVGMTPAYMDYTNGVFNWGSWRDAFFMPRPCMLNYDGDVDYYLDPNNYTKKYDGSASDVANDAYNGNAMMEWGQGGKKIWYAIVPDPTPTGASIYIADHQVNSNFHAWSFINNDGKLVDHFYTPIYNGWYDGTRIRSISGKTPTDSQNAQTERDRCRANNTALNIWDTEVYCDVILINFLCTLISKSLDSQTAFGQGCTTPGQAGVVATGTLNDKGLFFGYSGTTSAVKVFGMENWWGNLWRRFGGLVNVKGTQKYKLTRSTEDGSTVNDYVVSATDTDYAGYLTGATLPAASGGYINAHTFDANQYAPTAVNGASNTYYCDSLWTNNNQVDYASRGGASNRGVQCGAWSLSLSDAASTASWTIAAAPSCKPKALS